MTFRKLPGLIAVLFCALACNAADTFKVERDLTYVPGGVKSQSLDIYLPQEKSDKPIPIIVYIHGGGWEGGDKGGCWPSPLVARGYAAASINYRFSHEAKFPAQLQDCKAAIRWLRANAKKYNLDPDHIGVWGDSAGGHLVALLGTTGGSKDFAPVGGSDDQSDRVQAVCDWYGPTDFLTLDSQKAPNDVLHAESPSSPISKLIGGPVSQNKEAAAAASPIHYVNKDCPPFLVEHGTVDNIVPVAQSDEFVDALKKAGVAVEYRRITDAGHGSHMVNEPGWLDHIAAFFDKNLKPAGAGK